jgi:hypothetical protein
MDPGEGWLTDAPRVGLCAGVLPPGDGRGRTRIACVGGAAPARTALNPRGRV